MKVVHERRWSTHWSTHVTGQATPALQRFYDIYCEYKKDFHDKGVFNCCMCWGDWKNRAISLTSLWLLFTCQPRVSEAALDVNCKLINICMISNHGMPYLWFVKCVILIAQVLVFLLTQIQPCFFFWLMKRARATHKNRFLCNFIKYSCCKPEFVHQLFLLCSTMIFVQKHQLMAITPLPQRSGTQLGSIYS